MLRLLASATEHRWANYPDVKTLKEMGYDGRSVVPLGFACPAAVPPEIRARLERVVTQLQTTMKSLTIRLAGQEAWGFSINGSGRKARRAPKKARGK